MDNQQHQALKKLYTYLTGHSEASFDQLKTILHCDESELIDLISDLKQMGLDISVKDKNIRLLNPIDVIDVESITSILIQSNIAKPINYIFSTTSTNQIANSSKNDRIYLADYQNSGKGRQEKRWISPLGQSIAISITHNFNFGLNQLSGLNIAIGVAIIQTAKYFGIQGLGLKWPNDVIGEMGKIAGILIQLSGNKQKSHAIIGIGLNWNVREKLFESIEQECMNIPQTNVSRSEFIAQLIVQVEAMLKEFSNNKLQNILEHWQQHDIYKEQTVNILQDELKWQAKYIGINAQGLLLVEKSGNLKTIANGVVSIRKVDYSSK